MANVIIGLVLVLAFVLPQLSFTIAEWEQGMIVRFGDPQPILEKPGLYFKLPVIDTLVRFEKWVLSTDARTAEYLTLDKNGVGRSHPAGVFKNPWSFIAAYATKSGRWRD
jgi:membrane protease subunit HflC